jgi:hypothetical protein
VGKGILDRQITLAIWVDLYGSGVLSVEVLQNLKRKNLMADPKFLTGSVVFLKGQLNKIGQIISYVWYPKGNNPTVYTVYVDGQLRDFFEWDLMEAPICEEGNS